MSLFELIVTEIDQCPIVMIDNSGSTSDTYSTQYIKDKIKNLEEKYSTDAFKCNDNNNILQYEFCAIHQLLKNQGVKECNLMVWNSSVYSTDTKITLDELEKRSIMTRITGGTNVFNALQNIPADWFKKDCKNDIYIVTDGYTSGSLHAKEILKDLIHKNCRIYIITVETNEYDYINTNISAGNQFYKTIRDSKSTGYVKKFISYNKKHVITDKEDNPFVSFSNPDVKLGYSPFKDHVFRTDKIIDFIQYINKMIKEEKPNIIKLAHELTMTLYHFTKGKSIIIQTGIINLFADLFKDTDQFTSIRELFISEVDNHSKGMSNTFQDYRNNRNNFFQKAQLALFNDTKKSITYGNTLSYVSFITNTKSGDYLFEYKPEDVNGTVYINDQSYKNSSVKMADYVVPVIPQDINLDDNIYDQCTRQWARTNYAHKYGVNVASDDILYMICADFLRVYLSDSSQNFKKTYRGLARVMLDRKRYGTSIKEWDYLKDDNPPAPVVGDQQKIYKILKNAAKYIGLEKIHPMTFWYGVISAFNNDELKKSQFTFCQDGLIEDGIHKDDILIYLKNKVKPLKSITISQGISYDYTCLISLEDTSETGGYVIKPYNVTDSIICYNRSVMDKESFMEYKKDGLKCPITGKLLPTDHYIEVGPEKEELKKINKDVEIPELNEKYYHKDSHHVIKVDQSWIQKEITVDNIKTIDEYDFEVPSYSVEDPLIKSGLGNKKLTITTSKEFKENAFQRFPFLKGIKFDNVCLAGGFCRSVLLKQQLKDLDFFFYGKDHYKSFRNTLDNIIDVMNETYQKTNIKFIHLYKPDFNVYELIVVKDPANYLTEEFTLDNYKAYDFRTLRKFDQKLVIDPIKNQVKVMNNKWDAGLKLDTTLDKKIMEDEIARYKQLKEQKDQEVKKVQEEQNKEDDINDNQDNDKDDEDSSDEEETYMPKEVFLKMLGEKMESTDFNNYFEDGDKHGIKMLHRVQFIMVEYEKINDIFHHFDMYPSRVAFDGDKVYMTDKSAYAFKYMINVVNENNYSQLFGVRLKKYLDYGFNIIAPELDLEKIGIGSTTIDDVSFIIKEVNKERKEVIIQQNSHNNERIDALKNIEKRSLEEDGHALYKSNLFPSFVSVLRYVKINDIAYKFTAKKIVPDEAGKIQFREKSENIKFWKELKTRIPDMNWYGQYRSEKKEKTQIETK